MNQREIINLHMDNSEQKNSTEEDETKYIKTPELNLQEKYSHNNVSGNKISGKSTEKDGKVTKRFLSSQKKKSIKVSKEVLECKKDLIKLQKKSEYRKKKKMDEETQQKELERRKQNIATLNLMLKKRTQHFKKKKRNQEKLMKKEAINFEKPPSTSFNKKIKKKRIKVKNMKRNQTFSNLSNKSPCETMNTSKNQFSSHKKKNFHVSTGKKLNYKKMNESLKTNTSSKKLRSENKLGAKSVNASQYFNPNKGSGNTHKKRKTIKSESKKCTTDAVTHFNDISEIQEFNMTDEEESLINSSILKNIEEHESIKHTENAGKSSMKKTKTTAKKTLQTTKKKHKKTVKKTRLKFISSSKKSSKKTKKCTEKDPTDKSIKKRKVIFHSSKLKEVSPVERAPRDSKALEEAISPQNDYRDIESPEQKSEQIMKVEHSSPSIDNEEESDEVIDLKNSQGKRLIRDSVVAKNIERIDMIDSEKLSELLSSKKKHRYQEVKDSMDGVAETNIHQQINFTDEEENLNLHQYHSPGVDSPDQPQSLSQDEQVIKTALPCSNNSVKENKEFDIEGLIPEKEYIIESMTYQQIQDERNNIIEDPRSESENQTVINCTQSDQEDSSVDYEERISDRNAIIDESSLEYASVPQNYNPIHETTSEDQDEPAEEIHEERVFEYHNEHNEGENEEPEITSRREQRDISEHEQESEHSGPNYYPDSNESYSDIDMDEEAIEKFLNEPPQQIQDNGFEKTLTNMRLAFGSEKHIRENSVKTLERIDKSHRDSGSDEKTDEKSSVFEKNSFQDFSLKKFTELMNVKNMKNFKTSIQKTFREYNKDNIFSNSDKKASKMSSTPKKSSCISPRKFSMRDLELDRIGYEKMKEHSEKKNKFIQNIMGSSSSQNKKSHSSILYKTNLSLDKCRKEINMEDISDEQSSKNIEYKISSPKKNYQLLNDKPEKEEFTLEAQHVKSYDSPEPSKSVKSKRSSCKKIQQELEQTSEDQYNEETPFEDENIETVKLDSSRLRSQKRGLPMEGSTSSKEETPKGTFTQRRLRNAEESCNTGEKYVLGDCFTEEKNYEMRLRNAVTSAKKINPIQILKDLKSPGSSYISSAKKALAEEEYNENDRIPFEISEQKDHPIREFNDKENMRNNNIYVGRFGSNTTDGLKNFVNSNKFQIPEQDYNDLESPEESHHRHSKSRSRTKEKRGNRSDCASENFEILPDDGKEEDKTCMVIDFNTSPELKKKEETPVQEEMSQSIEWIIANNIDKKKRDEICKIVDGESRNLTTETHAPDSDRGNTNEIEVEEVKRIKFGNPMINNNIADGVAEDTEESNLGQYIECLESVESSANKSVKAYAEKELMKNPEETSEHMTDEILSMMLFNDIHDCPMHPIRENNFVDYFKDKYPFNRDLGIDTTEIGTNKYLDDLCTYLEKNHLDMVYRQLLKPVYVDPLSELKKLQALDDFYNDEAVESEKNSQSDCSELKEEPDNGLILPQQVFYEFEEVRKEEFNKEMKNLAKPEYTDSEIEDKIKYTFIHDKVIFDAFNNALNLYGQRKETLRPWIKQNRASYDRDYTVKNIQTLFEKSKKKVNDWINICAGTRKIPPPSVLDAYNQTNDGFGDTIDPNQMSDEERLQQLREERLSLMLREIQEEDNKWNEFEACEIQIKLDLADMVLETLVCEVIDILNK